MLERNYRRQGFTIVEILLVIVILSMLIGVAVFTMGRRQESSAIDITRLKLKKIEGKLKQYKLDMSRGGHGLPTEEDGGLEALLKKPEDEEKSKYWTGPYLESDDLLDAWKQKINYEKVEGEASESGKAYKIWSSGPNKQNDQGDEDDILPSEAAKTDDV